MEKKKTIREMTKKEYNKYHQEYYQDNKEKIKGYYSSDDSKEKRKGYSKKWLENNRDTWNAYILKRYYENKKNKEVKEQEDGNPTQQ